MKYVALSVILSFLFTQTALGQKHNDGLVVRMDGYLINLDGEVIFQPCEDSSVNFWQSLDGRSFGIWCNQITGEQYCEATERLGDSLNVNYQFVTDTFYNRARLSYFYCTIESAIFFVGNNANDFKVYDHPQYQMLYKGKPYPLKGFYIREVIRQVIPKKQRDLLAMYHYYVTRGSTVPEWLEIEIKKKTGK